MISAKKLKRKVRGMLRRWEKDRDDLHTCGAKMMPDGEWYNNLSEVDRNLSTAIAYAYGILGQSDQSLEDELRVRFE